MGEWGVDSPILKVPSAIINRFTLSGAAVALSALAGQLYSVYTGAHTATTLKELLNISGAGVLQLAALWVEDTTSRTIQLKIVMDGVTVFDVTTAAITTANVGIMGAGFFTSNTAATPILQHLPFYSSLVISGATSLNETDKLNFSYVYYLTN